MVRALQCVPQGNCCRGFYFNLDTKRKFIMRKSIGSRALVAATFIACMAALAPTAASAQEGARSVGHGIKCRQSVVLQADGSYKVQQVCYKSV
jgi:ABC-type phosphate transport system substrate-binding protein